MKIQVKTKALRDAMQIPAGVVPSQTLKPILENVRINVSKSGTEILATDLEVAVRCTVEESAVKQEGSVVVPAKELYSILQESANEEDVVLSSEEQGCRLVWSDSEFVLPAADPADFPEIQQFDEKEYFELKADVLQEMIAKTAFAVSKERTRYALNGVLFILREDGAEMVATDGHRMAYVRKRMKHPKGTEKQALLSQKALEELRRAITSEDKTVRVNVRENDVVFSVKRSTVSTRVIEGHFPDFRSVIPTDNDKKVDLPLKDIVSAVRRAALMTTPETMAVRMELNKGGMQVYARSPEKGEARVRLSVGYEGDKIDIGFNPMYLLDMFKVVTDEKVRIELRDSERPGLLRAGTDYQYVVMPVTTVT